MSFSSKNDTRMMSIILIALIGGVLGGYLSTIYQDDRLSESLTGLLVTKESEISSLSEKVTDLEDQLTHLQSNLIDSVSIPVKDFNTPDFDSGWLEIEQDSSVDIVHDLESSDVFVYILGESEQGYHRSNSGRDVWFEDRFNSEGEFEHNRHFEGIWWRTVSNDMLTVSRGKTDYSYERIRVLVWVLPVPPVDIHISPK